MIIRNFRMRNSSFQYIEIYRNINMINCTIPHDKNLSKQKSAGFFTRIRNWIQTFTIEGAEYMSKTK